MDLTHQRLEALTHTLLLPRKVILTTNSMAEAVLGAALILLLEDHHLTLTINATMAILPRIRRTTLLLTHLRISTAPIPSLILVCIRLTLDITTLLQVLTHIPMMMKKEQRGMMERIRRDDPSLLAKAVVPPTCCFPRLPKKLTLKSPILLRNLSHRLRTNHFVRALPMLMGTMFSVAEAAEPTHKLVTDDSVNLFKNSNRLTCWREERKSPYWPALSC
mmetsp:Transcript_31023/g.64731  ORF Transcript_31023/g.64731 Transcript_31023/m.64731 type:complete len:219 (-) Transcript_31023:785-1441(-)